MNAKEFDTMEADLKYRKHLKYSQADMDEKLSSAVIIMKELVDLCEDEIADPEDCGQIVMAKAFLRNAEIEK